MLGERVDVAHPGIGGGADAMHQNEIRTAIPGVVVAGTKAVNRYE